VLWLAIALTVVMSIDSVRRWLNGLFARRSASEETGS
jgi:hypothetical protein